MRKGDHAVTSRRFMTLLDIGATKICIAAASMDGEPLGLAVVRTPGWPERRPLSSELAAAVVEAVGQVAEMAESKRTGRVWVALCGAALRITAMAGIVRTRAADRQVGADDVERAMQAALPSGSDAIHKILAATILDGREMLEDPIGQLGRRLEVRVFTIEADSERRDGLMQALQTAGLTIHGFIAGPLATTVVLTPAEKEIGTVAVDMGATHTSICVCARGWPRYLASIGLGGHHITKDLAVAYGWPVTKTEAFKIETFTQEDALESSAVFGKVAAARLEEIFDHVQADLVQAGWAPRIPGGYVLTGGASAPAGLPRLAARLLGKPVRKGVVCLQAMEAGPAFTVALGLAPIALGRLLADDGRPGLIPKGVHWWRSRSQERSSPV